MNVEFIRQSTRRPLGHCSLLLSERLLINTALLGMLSGAVTAAENTSEFPNFALHGVLDLRYQVMNAQSGELQHGLGKFRSGAEGDRLRVNESAIVLQMRLGWDWSGTFTLKYADKQYNPLDLTEAFLSYRPVSTSGWRIGGRMGMFFPPISLENTGTAWSSPYTLNSSAINSWVGEELRSFGGEAQLSYQLDSGDRLGLFAAGLANNDATGVLLAWRGWSLQDYESTLRDRLRLPDNIGTRSLFPRQAAFTQPFVEVDGRPGYYVGLNAEQANRYTFRALYYDNSADPSAINNGQYAWHTRFFSLGLKAELPWELTLISQGISGRTSMGDIKDGKRAVDVGFWSASLLFSKSFGNHRLSFRHDRFGTDENDYLPQDRNAETGYAWTANYNLTLAQRHQLNFEVSHINSNRPARASLGRSSDQEETLWQIAYRLFF
jgi:hypothetical protein